VISRIALAALVVACGHSSDPGSTAGSAMTIPGVELAELITTGHEAAAQPPAVIVSPTEIRVEGMAVVAVRGGDVDPAEKEGGTPGIKMPRLSRILGKLPGGHMQPLMIAIDRHITYRVLVEILFSAKQKEAGWKDFALLARARTGGAIVAIPIRLPDKKPADAVAFADLVEGSPPPAIRFEPPADRPDTSLTSDVVLAKIQSAYMGGIRRCYKNALKAAPGTKGKLKLSFTVGLDGRIGARQVTGLAPPIDECVQNVMQAWRFPIPKDSAQKPAEATFAVTLQLVPDADAPAAPPPAANPEISPPESDLQLVVTISKKEILLWSISGLEGTLQEPKLRIARSDATAAAQISQALAEIIKRRWVGQSRPETSRSIIFMADGDVAMSTVIEMFGAMRATPDGGVLFPDLLLSTGFE
jgi:hypothetical protein